MEKKMNWSELLKDKSVVVNHADVEAFTELFKSVGLNPMGGADLGEMGKVIYF